MSNLTFAKADSKRKVRWLFSQIPSFNSYSTVSLLYSGDRDGWKFKDFHRTSDGKYPTLVLVQSSNGRIFGGFSTTRWYSYDKEEQGKYEADDSAFVFSLDNEKIYKP